MLAKVIEQRGMSVNGQGQVTQGSMTKQEVYNYPLTASGSGANLTDAPTYTSCTETWTRDGTNFDSATTHYEVFQNSTPAHG